MKKTYRAPLRVKAAEEGQIECTFATMETGPDADNDLTLKGAFGEQRNIVLEGWGHDMGLPIGRGRIFEVGNEARFKGRIFLETTAGRDHFEALRAMRDDGGRIEFSYTFDILDAKRATFNGRPGRILKALTVYGVSPVRRGAGNMTRLVQLKSADGLSAMTPAALGRYVDQLLSARLFDRLAKAEKTVQKHAGRKSGLAAYRDQLAAEHGTAWADAAVENEIGWRVQQLEYQFPYFVHDPMRARAVAIAAIESDLA